jgi:hypothetical protein
MQSMNQFLLWRRKTVKPFDDPIKKMQQAAKLEKLKLEEAKADADHKAKNLSPMSYEEWVKVRHLRKIGF